MILQFLRLRNIAAFRSDTQAGCVDHSAISGRPSYRDEDGLDAEALVGHGTPVNPVAGAFTVAIGGVCLDRETLTLAVPLKTPLTTAGDLTTEIYEFNSRDGTTPATTGAIQVNIVAVTTKATSTLTLINNLRDDDQIKVGANTYTIKDAPSADPADKEIGLGSTAIATMENIVAYINANDLVVGCAIGTGLTIVFTALAGGVYTGDSTDPTDISSAMSFGAATFTGGNDCTAAEACTALEAEATAHSALFNIVDGTTEVVVTSKVAGLPSIGGACSTTGANITLESDYFGYGKTFVTMASLPADGKIATIGGLKFELRTAGPITAGSDYLVLKGATKLTAAAALAASVNAAFADTELIATDDSATNGIVTFHSPTQVTVVGDTNIVADDVDTVAPTVLAVNGTPSLRGGQLEDGSFLYTCITEGDLSTAAWKKCTLASL